MESDIYRKDSLVLTFDSASLRQTLTVIVQDKVITLDAAETSDLIKWLYQRSATIFQLRHENFIETRETNAERVQEKRKANAEQAEIENELYGYSTKE